MRKNKSKKPTGPETPANGKPMRRRLLWVRIVAITVLMVLGLGGYLLVDTGIKENKTKDNLNHIDDCLNRYLELNYKRPSDCQYTGYPAYLYGGGGGFNIGSSNGIGLYNRLPEFWHKRLAHPYDERFADDNDGWRGIGWDTMAHDGYHSLGFYWKSFDPLQHEYPRNPFATKKADCFRFSADAIESGDDSYAGYGGRDGYQMWNLGFWGECVQLMLEENKSKQARLDFPGCFYYHPRWADGASNYGHLLTAQQDNPGSWLPGDRDPALRPPLSDMEAVSGTEVGGYDLWAFGSRWNKGKDLDVSLPGGETPHMFRTGYMVNGEERNPWVQAGDYEGCEDFDDRPYADGIGDFVVFTLRGGDEQ